MSQFSSLLKAVSTPYAFSNHFSTLIDDPLSQLVNLSNPPKVLLLCRPSRRENYLKPLIFPGDEERLDIVPPKVLAKESIHASAKVSSDVKKKKRSWSLVSWGWKGSWASYSINLILTTSLLSVPWRLMNLSSKSRKKNEREWHFRRMLHINFWISRNSSKRRLTNQR